MQPVRAWGGWLGLGLRLGGFNAGLELGLGGVRVGARPGLDLECWDDC